MPESHFADEFLPAYDAVATFVSSFFRTVVPVAAGVLVCAVLAGILAARRMTRRLVQLDAAARDFLAGMTDRYAVNLFEQLFVRDGSL